MHMIKTILAVFALSALPAMAATVDFTEEANGNERGVADGTVINSANTSGLNVTLSAEGDDVAYLDSYSSGKPGGLGVCSTGLTNSDQCVVRSDDNVTGSEVVNVKFDDGAGGNSGDVDQITFNDANHNAYNGDVAISFDGGATYQDYAVVDGVLDLSSPTEGNFTAAGISFKVADNGSQFYVATIGSGVGGVSVNPVPIPANILLLGTGLAAFGVWAKKKKARQATA